MKRIGPHVSSAGGVDNAPRNARAFGATAFALFTRNQRTWRSKELTAAAIDGFKEACDELGFPPESVLPHDSYLINLGSADPALLEKSRAAFLDELIRCEQLGLMMLNFHPGAHKDEMAESDCLDLIAEGINWGLDETERVIAVIENDAGQGTHVGYNFEQIAHLIDRIEDKSRVGVCLDTCHAFASGYDLRTADAYEEMITAFDRVIGLDYLKALHLNDSKTDLGSRVDRHDSIGQGTIGEEAFRLIMEDERLDGRPCILETVDKELWSEEVRRLSGYAGIDVPEPEDDAQGA